jgi:hypothetical protein
MNDELGQKMGLIEQVTQAQGDWDWHTYHVADVKTQGLQCESFGLKGKG